MTRRGVTATRYVEVTYDTGGETRWFGMVLDAPSPSAALAVTLAEVCRQHPDADDPREFMQRVLEPDAAAKITAAMEAGTWEGWDFTARSQG